MLTMPLSAAVPERVRFNLHVKPILSQNCFFCHGPDEKHREAELRLDVREAALADLGGYAAIVPGKPDASALIARVASHDDDEVMPPPASKKPRLSSDDVAILRRWIEQGAEYEGHWAFLPLAHDELPAVKDESWVRNPIDRFILARLDEVGLKPSGEADRAILIRRLNLDLLGLLPSPAEVRQFVDDKDPQAYEALVDRVLGSPHYGERWGRYWLDQARYADSNGYTIDAEREMWPYRDWVIQALNADMPFDQFTIEQLAGDLLPSPSKPQLVATAFLRNTLINQEGGTDREQFRVESVMDRTSTTGAVWLGLTVGCAQCHAHKFDPISQREYYELLAFFNSTEDINDRGPTVDVLRGEMFGMPVSVEPVPIDKLDPAQRRAEWEKDELAQREAVAIAANTTRVTWSPAQYVQYGTDSNAGFRLLDDNSLLTDGGASFNDTYQIDATTTLKQVAAVRLRVITHESLPSQGPGLAGNGNFVLTDFKLSVSGQEQAFSRASADHEQPGYSIAAVIDKDNKTGWAINVAPGSAAKMNADHEAVFVLKTPLAAAGETLRIRLYHDVNEKYLIGRFAIDFADIAPPPMLSANDEAMLVALRTAAAQRSPAQSKLLQQAFDRSKPRPPKNPDLAQLMVMRERKEPRETFLLTRGDFTRPDKSAGPLEPGLLHAVPPPITVSLQTTASPQAQGSPHGKRLTRLDLARWLVHPDNPLTPRVTMNRTWMRYFGRGLVETEEDFGSQGSGPTHPALLDWLSGEFIRGGWSPKHMHRLIVTSATYRQSSKQRDELLQRDPRNLLLARQQRLRLDAEVVRDAALCASGLLDRTIGGQSVHPPQPDGVYAFTQVARQWKADSGPNRYRRGVYTFFFRSAPYPLFTTFDTPDFQAVCTRRPRSNTPLQSLTMANDVAFVEMAQAMAMRLAQEVPGDGEQQLVARINHAFELALSRQPSSEELTVLRAYLGSQREGFSKDSEAAGKLATPALSAVVSLADGAVLVCLARALLNTDNFITRE
jgi:hypothetical protein